MSTYRFVRAEEAHHTARTLCRVLHVSRSSYYAWRAGTTHQHARDTALSAHIRAVYRHHHGRYGSPRVTAELKAQGHDVGRRRVARLMRQDGLQGRPRRRFHPNTTLSRHERPVAPNRLERNFQTDAPNRVLVGDLTYLPVAGGWAYLAVLLDLFSRKVVGWAMAEHMETSLCLEALRRAAATRGDLTGAIHHTDRGAQYASLAYQAELESMGMLPSMSRKGDCWDNAVAESFFGTLEQELVQGRRWASFPQARRDVGAYIHRYYNGERRHSTLGQVSPVEFETDHWAAKEAAA